MRSSLPPDKPGLLRRAARVSRREWIGFAQAIRELAIARLTLAEAMEPASLKSSDVVDPNASDREKAQAIGLAVTRASRFVPWRSDCLVQAKAARRWLARDGIASALHIGVRPGAGGDLDAHAWLTCGTVNVTGGEGADYAVLQPPTAPRTREGRGQRD